MRKRIYMVLFMIIGFWLFFGEQAEAAVNPDGSVSINEENFPDQRFRYLASTYDANKDAVLSMAERSVLKDLTLKYTTYYDSVWQEGYAYIGGVGIADGDIVVMEWRRNEGDTAPLSVKGIEYFPKLRRYCVNAYTDTVGSLQNNKELTEIRIGVGNYTDESWPCKLEDSSRLEQDFPLKQIKKLEIGPDFECKKFSLRNAKELEELSIGVASEYETAVTSVLGEVDLSDCKKLKKLFLHGVKLKKLDLRKNTELRAVEFGGNAYLWDYSKKLHARGILYPGHGEKFSCTLKLPPNNRIKNLIWISDTGKLDLTSCRKLEFLQVSGGVDLRFNKKWYQTYGKKKLAVFARGTKIRKKVKKKEKQTVWIKTPKLPDWSPDHVGQLYEHG